MIIQNGFAGLQLSVMRKRIMDNHQHARWRQSYYTNCIRGDKYWDYMAKELPENSVYVISICIEKKRIIMWLVYSMGGYGSMKLALNYPDSF